MVLRGVNACEPREIALTILPKPADCIQHRSLLAERSDACPRHLHQLVNAKGSLRAVSSAGQWVFACSFCIVAHLLAIAPVARLIMLKPQHAGSRLQSVGCCSGALRLHTSVREGIKLGCVLGQPKK